MEFRNAGIDIDRLPRAEELTLRPIEPEYLKVLFRQWIAGWLITLIIVSIIIWFSTTLRNPVWLSLIAVGVIALALLNWWLVKKSFQYKAYAIRDHDIIYRTGWLIQSVRTCPFNRIQHCSVDSGLFERKFGLAKLAVFTSGGSEADMKIPGLKAETTSTIRELIIQKTGIDVSSS